MAKQNKNKIQAQSNAKSRSNQKGFTSMGYGNNNSDPRFTAGKGCTVIAHRELVEIVASQSSFNVAQKRINPSHRASFPWLSGIANKYEKYRFRKLKFQLIPHAPTTASGTLGMYIDYDPSDRIAPSATNFFSNANAVTSQIWLDTTTVAKQQQMQLFCQEDVSITDKDIKWFDFARIFFYMQSPGANGAQTAWLFVEYEIELYNPTPNSDEALFTPEFTAYAYWTSSQSTPAFTNEPSIIKGVQYVFEDGEAQLSVPYNGFYRVTVLTANTNSGASVTEIFQSPVSRIINGLDANGNPTTREQTIIVQLEQGVTYVPLRMSTGILDVFADPDDNPSPLGVHLELLKAT